MAEKVQVLGERPHLIDFSRSQLAEAESNQSGGQVFNSIPPFPKFWNPKVLLWYAVEWRIHRLAALVSSGGQCVLLLMAPIQPASICLRVCVIFPCWLLNGIDFTAGHISIFPRGGGALRVPRVSMTVKRWVHDPLILGNDPMF